MIYQCGRCAHDGTKHAQHLLSGRNVLFCRIKQFVSLKELKESKDRQSLPVGFPIGGRSRSGCNGGH